MTIKLYYQNVENNFGDVLSKEIVSFFANENVIWSDLKKSDLVAIGSLAERVVLKKMKRFFLCFGKPLDVWGTGFLKDGSQVSERFLRIHALRGKYSQKRFGQKNIPLGDPGLLASFVYPRQHIESGKIVCLPHLHDRCSMQWIDKIRLLYPQKDIISVNLSNSLESIINHIVSSDFIVSTAMHPLIVAQSYGVPFVWLESDTSLHAGARYKFEDYFSVFDSFPVAITKRALLASGSNISEFERALDSSIVPRDIITSIQQDLISVFPGI